MNEVRDKIESKEYSAKDLIEPDKFYLLQALLKNRREKELHQAIDSLSKAYKEVDFKSLLTN